MALGVLDARLAGHRRYPALLFGLGVALAIATLALWPRGEILAPDSGSYLEWHGLRGAAYPLILRGLGVAGLGLIAIVKLQIFLHAAMTIFLAIELHRLTRSALLPVATLVGAMRPDVLDWAAMILTEGFFFPALIAASALAIRLARTRRIVDLVLLSLSLGFAAILRPIGYALLPALVLLPLWFGLRGLRFHAWALVPAIALIALSTLAYRIEHGSFRAQSLLGLSLVGKITFAEAPSPPGRHPELEAIIAEQTRAARVVDARLPSWSQRFAYRADHYDPVRFGPFYAASRERAEELGMDADALRAEVALDFIRHDPGAYLYDVWLSYLALWTGANHQTRSASAELARQVAPEPPPTIVGPGHAWPVIAMVRTVRVTLALAAFAALGIGVWALIRRRSLSPLVAVAAFLATAVHGYLVLVALTQSAQIRYPLAVWPMLVVVFALLIAAAKPEAA